MTFLMPLLSFCLIPKTLMEILQPHKP